MDHQTRPFSLSPSYHPAVSTLDSSPAPSLPPSPQSSPLPSLTPSPCTSPAPSSLGSPPPLESVTPSPVSSPVSRPKYVDEDSDSDPFLYSDDSDAAARMPPPNQSCNAIITQTGPDRYPLFGVGTISFESIRRFGIACYRVFQAKGVPPESQVGRIMYCFERDNVIAWVEANHDTLLALTFDEFMTEFKSKWLPRDWQDQLVDKVIERQPHDISFADWIITLTNANSYLKGRPSHVPDDQLRDHIIARFSDHLRQEYHSADVNDLLLSIEDFDAWVKEVTRIDDNLQAQRARARSDWLESYAQFGLRGRNVVNLTQPLQVPATSAIVATSSSNTTSNPLSSLKPLTPDERALLIAHRGCFKCRAFYVTHLRSECVVTPTAQDCGNVNPVFAAKARATWIKNGSPTRNTPVTVSSSNAAASTPAVVAAVFEQENVSDEGFELSNGYGGNEYVDPFSLPLPRHLFWDCVIDSNVSDHPVSVHALIDHGAPPVLISRSLAHRLRLQLRPLRKPLDFSGAFSSPETKSELASAYSPSSNSLTDYVRITVSSPDFAWKSRAINAIVSPSLSCDLILGLDFLVSNTIVVDAESRTVVDKTTGFDLLHPPDPKLARCVPAVSPFVRRQSEARRIKLGQRATRELRKEVHVELNNLFASDRKRFDMVSHTTSDRGLIASVHARIHHLAGLDVLQKLDKKFKADFPDRFPQDIPHVRDLPHSVYHNIEITSGASITTSRAYTCPRKFHDGWKTLIDQHSAAGRIRPSSSAYTSPSFIVPKLDPNVLPRWVNDFRALNRITVPDNYPLPCIDDILADAAKGKIWGKIDMTNSFFQTLVNPDHVKYTATLTPFGLWEWVVMPMGLRNSPATHQRRVTMALKVFLGKSCYVYLDDIIIWSNSLNEHKQNVANILRALRDAELYCSLKKSTLFATEVDFLGHHISARGIEADNSKVERILNWPAPKSAKDVRQFLGLVRYLSVFLPNLAEQTTVLTPLTRKECNRDFPPWETHHQYAFEAIKRLVVSRECLTSIDHKTPGDNKIFVTCDASQRRTGAVLSFGPTWETARLVAFESRQLHGPELHYPVHEQELLAIMRALKRWRCDLLGSHINILTDHRTLENFDMQKDLSKRQARWMEYLSQYEFTISYIDGEKNTIADALSRMPDVVEDPPSSIFSVLEIKSDPEIVCDIKEGYLADKWCQRLTSDLKANLVDPKLDITRRNGLLFVGSRLVIPNHKSLRENLFRLAHDDLGHFGGDKSYGNLQRSFYWPNMRRDLYKAYVPSCPECQRNKSRTTKVLGPLHPLPVPDDHFTSVAIDFVGPLPKDGPFDSIVTMTDRLGADLQLPHAAPTSPPRNLPPSFSTSGTARTGCRSRLSATVTRSLCQNSGDP